MTFKKKKSKIMRKVLSLPFFNLAFSSGGRSSVCVCACVFVHVRMCTSVCVCVWRGRMRACSFFTKTQRTQKVRSQAQARTCPRADGRLLRLLLSVRALPAPGFSRFLIHIHLRITSSGFRNKSHLRRQLDCGWIYWLVAGWAAFRDWDLLPRDTGYFAR